MLIGLEEILCLLRDIVNKIGVPEENIICDLSLSLYIINEMEVWAFHL